ncbi:MAG: hypothetical protein HOY69_08590 [Streptomyces sp.]|nr:hypothetical protein [Streptomyces sp.]
MPDFGGGAAPRDLTGDVDPDVTAPGAGEAVDEAASEGAAAQESPDAEDGSDGE